MNLVALDGRGDALEAAERVDLRARPGEVAIVADAHPARFVASVRTLLEQGAVPMLLPPATPPARIEALAERVDASLFVAGAASRHRGSHRRDAGRFEATEPTYLAATSGTSGAEPNVYAFSLARARANADAHLRSLGITAARGQRILFPLPLAHSFGFVCGALAAEALGATLIATTEHPMPATLLELARVHGATALHTTPTALRAFARTRDARFEPALEVVSIGSAPATLRDAALLARLAPHARRYATYGLTEAGPRVATLALDDVDSGTGDGPLPLGAPIDGVTLRLAARDDAEAELEVRSRYLATHRLRSDGFESIADDTWWPTADRVSERSGSLVLLGRSDGVVVRGGVNLYPGTIEPVYERVSGVRAVCLIRRASAMYGEVPVLVVEADESDAIRSELDRIADGELMPVERPVELIFVTALPRTDLGKVRRGVVQAEFGGS